MEQGDLPKAAGPRLSSGCSTKLLPQVHGPAYFLMTSFLLSLTKLILFYIYVV